MRKKVIKVITAVMAVMLILLFHVVPAAAYYNRGQITVSCGTGSVSLEAAQETYVSVSVSPSEDSHPPGCGMPECPDSCDVGCMDENGNCICAGSDYQTYYTDVSVTSSNSAVAVGSYWGGTLVITGISPGEATLTLTGTLVEWTSGAASVNVSVSAPAQPEPDPDPQPQQPSDPSPGPQPGENKEPDENKEPGDNKNENKDKENKNEGNKDKGDTNQNGDTQDGAVGSFTSGPSGEPASGENGTNSREGTAGDTSSGSVRDEKAKELLDAMGSGAESEGIITTAVPYLAPGKEWAVYSLGGDDTGEDTGGREKQDPLKAMAAGTGALLFLGGILGEFIGYRRRI